MGFDDALYSPGFYLLAGGAVLATLMGYKLGQSWGAESFPIWQLILILIVEVAAAFFFAAQD